MGNYGRLDLRVERLEERWESVERRRGQCNLGGEAAVGGDFGGGHVRAQQLEQSRAGEGDLPRSPIISRHLTPSHESARQGGRLGERASVGGERGEGGGRGRLALGEGEPIAAAEPRPEEGSRRSVGGRWEVGGRSVEGRWKVGGRSVEGRWKAMGGPIAPRHDFRKRGEPRQRSLPSAMMAMRSERISASSRKCVVSTIVRPSRCSRSSAQIERRECGSMPGRSEERRGDEGRSEERREMRGDQRRGGEIRRDQRTGGAIRGDGFIVPLVGSKPGDQGRSGEIRGDQRRSGDIRGDQRRSEEISLPLVGSSRKTVRGEESSAMARHSLRFCPPESALACHDQGRSWGGHGEVRRNHGGRS